MSAALLVAFLVIETRVEAPLMPLRIFRLKTLAGANAVGFLLGGSFFAFIFIGTLYMQQVLGYSAIRPGSPGWPRRSPRSRSPACPRRWSPRFGSSS